MKTVKHGNPPASREFSSQERVSSKYYCHRKEEQTDVENLAKGTQESSKQQGLGGGGDGKALCWPETSGAAEGNCSGQIRGQ